MFKRIIFLLCFAGLASLQAQVVSLRKFRKTEKDSLERALMLLDQKNYLPALPIFEALYNQHPEEEFLKLSFAKCGLYKPEKQSEAFVLLKQVYEKNRKAPDIQYYMALGSYYNYFFDDALIYISTYANSKYTKPEGKKSADILKYTINYARFFYARPGGAKVTLPGGALNTEFNESMPAITCNDSLLAYASASPSSKGGLQRLGWQSQYNEDVQLATKTEQGFTPSMHSNQSLNTPQRELPLSWSLNGQHLFLLLTGNAGDLYMSCLNGHQLSKPQKLKGPVNSEFDENYCSLSPDGKTLYFSSNRPGGKGGWDLYKASLSADSTWTSIVNLGDSVNTAFDEDAPFIHADGKTLFFSSKGRSSMGGYDVFKASLNPSDSLFKRTENLGFPINTPYDDLYFSITANAENAYYSSYRKEGKGQSDIYTIEPNFRTFKPSLCLLSGKVSLNGRPQKALVQVVLPNSEGNVWSKSYSSSSNGTYKLALPTGTHYRITYQLKGYKEKEVDLDLSDMQGYVEKVKEVMFNRETDSLIEKKPEPVMISETRTLVAPEKPQSPQTMPDTSLTQEKIVKKNTEIPAASVPTPSVLNKSGTSAVRVPEMRDASDLVDSLTTSARLLKQQIRELEKSLAKSAEESKVEADLFQKRMMLRQDSLRIAEILNKKVVVKEEEKVVEPVLTKKELPKEEPSKKPPVVKEAPKEEPKPLVKDEFVPRTKVQRRIMEYVEKYGDITHEELEFRVQITAYKSNNNYYFPELVKFGKIEKLELGDGYKRLMMGGSFSSIRRAFSFARKIVMAGHDEIYIIAFYKGKRRTIEELEEIGILK